MIGTFTIEILLFIYTIIRYKMSPLSRLIGAALVLLATFQYAEYHVCEGIGSSDIYARVGFMAITMLPPVGIHIVSKIAGKSSRALTGAAYGSGALFALTFGFAPSAFDSTVCAGNYAIFHLVPNLGGAFMAYYYFWLFAGIAMCLKFRTGAKREIREALDLQAIGYLSFVLPTGFVNFVSPTTWEGLPSIMCGFAVIYALILTFGIAPRVLKEKSISLSRA